MIRGVLIDLEETLWVVEKDPAYQNEAMDSMAALAGWADPPGFYHLLLERLRRYQEWARAERKEAGDFELWHEWLLPEMDAGRLRLLCHDLTAPLRRSMGRRKTAPGGLRAVRTLYDRGYRLGIVSNSLGERYALDWLEESGLKQYFEAVIVSSVCHARKPGPAVFRLACRELGLEPAECASISCGDFEGEIAAGIGARISLAGPDGAVQPDFAVERFQEVLELPILL